MAGLDDWAAGIDGESWPTELLSEVEALWCISVVMRVSFGQVDEGRVSVVCDVAMADL